jgi:glycosyltransferase involved in cell wall biosynthesis
MKELFPLVTALVPSYNHGRYIRERIESIIGQNYPAVELIVIDDASEDDSDQIILALQSQYDFKYIRNSHNSGTPFAAWERICDLAKGSFIWVCESDDVAEPEFLKIAVNRLQAKPNAVMFYSSSLIINEVSETIGHTDSYFHDIWKESRWDKDFSADGCTELTQFQLRGQTVPNMSSALFTTTAFCAAFTPFLKRLRLTGDWLFVGDILKQGDVEFSHLALSRFRKHQVTSRVRVKSARSQAEFILTKYHLYRGSGQPSAAFARLMGSDTIRFLYEPASWFDVAKQLMSISIVDTVLCAFLLATSLLQNPMYVKKFRDRYAHAREWRINNE